MTSVPPRSLVLGNIGDVKTDARIKSGELTVIDRIPEADRDGYLVVMRR